jgi:hypothetical protein
MGVFEVAKRLQVVDGFQERFISAARLARYKRETWQVRKQRGLKVY